jgi:hypothetical protein
MATTNSITTTSVTPGSSSNTALSTNVTTPDSQEGQFHAEEHEMQPLAFADRSVMSRHLPSQIRQPVPGQPDRHEIVTDSRPQTSASGKFRLSGTRLAESATILALLLTIAFGVGGWQGMQYANRYAKSSYQVALYQLCLSPVLGTHCPKTDSWW